MNACKCWVILGASRCVVVHWIVRTRRLLAYSNKAERAKAKGDIEQARKLGYKAP